MSTILDKIVAQTREDLAKRRREVKTVDFRSFEQYERERRSMYEALQVENEVAIIAEIKKASPSKGLIRPDFNPQKLAESYLKGGASAISVLTDEPFFKGHLSYLEKVSKLSDKPVLRKDFIIDPYQVEEARAYGADAILLIVQITEGSQLRELVHAAHEAGLECLVECYDENDFKQVSFNETRILGVNNRDLNTFEVQLHRGVSLLEQTPDRVVRVSESGITSVDDLRYLYEHGVHAALIGEQFMRKPDPGQAVRDIREQLLESVSSFRRSASERNRGSSATKPRAIREQSSTYKRSQAERGNKGRG